MSPYRPSTLPVLTTSLGTWTAPGRPDRIVALTLDTKLFVWLVNSAAKKSTLAAKCALGTPPLTVTLT